MSRDIAPFGVRMPAELKEALEQRSKQNKRSLNAEVVSRLEYSVLADDFVQSSVGYDSLLHTIQNLENDFEELRARSAISEPFGRQLKVVRDDILESLNKINEKIEKLDNQSFNK